MSQEFKKERTLLFAFMNGNYKKIKVIDYDHKEWIICTKVSGKQVYINSSNVKWIEEIDD